MELKQLEKLVCDKLSESGYELVSMTYSNKTLSIVVDRVEPIDMDAIVEVTNVINALLDKVDPFESEYTLDVSSLGAEKPLKVEKLHDYVNSYVNVHLTNPINGENIYEGDLVSVSEDNIVLSYRQKTRTKTVDIQKSNISKIRLAIKF